MEDWAEIRRLHRSEGMGIKAIARRLGVSRNTVRSAVAAAPLSATFENWTVSTVKSEHLNDGR